MEMLSRLVRACLLLAACALFPRALAQQQLTLIPITNVWKYDLSGADFTGQFQQINYDDSAWPSGPGLLGYDLSSPFPYPDPILTEFPLGSSYRMTLYFRTHFNFPSNTLGAVLRATNYVDDGAVFYLNGHEVQRLRLPGAPITANTSAAISNPEGQGNVLNFATTNLVQGDNVLAVEVHQNQVNDPDVIFGMSLIAFLPEPGPVRITNQPPSRTIEEGESTTFTAEIAGTPPYFFQWFKDGSPINNATNPSLMLSFVSAGAAGEYSFSVSNEFNSVVSSNATLTIGPAPFVFVSMTNSWSYHADGVNLGVSWRNTSFNDSSWLQGTGLFHNHPDPLPAPKGTQIPLTASGGQNITTWYFRTRFNWSDPTAGIKLRARTLIDDGAVFYLNGVEAGRLGMAAPPTFIGYNSTATYRVESPTNYTVIELASSSLVQGENVLAIEVHQSAVEASDVVFGLALGTNFTLTLPDLVFWGPASAITETRAFYPDDCEMLEGCGTPNTRRVLRFATETRNVGQADLVLGDPIGNPLYVHDPCHGHHHFRDFAEYRLLDTNGVQVAVGNKVGFCLLDYHAWDANAGAQSVYDCEYQGIQRGWADIYDADLPCQWIDITDLPGGTYILELEIDPENRVAEANEENNVTHVWVSFSDCPAPVNDNFDSAQVINEAITTFSVGTQCATVEIGEPDHAFQPGGASVWYRWTAPGSGKLFLNTHGSRFDTLLAVYHGASVGNLTHVASDDDSGPYGTSRLMFDVTPSVRYSIAVDGWSGAGSNAVLNFHYKPMVAPALLTPEYFPGGPGAQLRLTLSGGAADGYQIETSTDLTTWADWLRVTNRTGTVQVIDPAAMPPQRFYRARLLP